MATYQYSNNTYKSSIADSMLVVALKVDVDSPTIFEKLAETTSDTEGNFTLTWQDWGGRVAIGAVDDSNNPLDCVFIDWVVAESQGWDITSLTSAGNLSIAYDSPDCIDFNADGTKAYVGFITSPGRIVEYELSVAYDMTTAVETFNFSTGIYQVYDIKVSNDGSKIWYITDTSQHRVRSVNLSTPYDLSTGSNGATFDLSPQFATGPSALEFSPDEQRFFVANRGGEIYSYLMSSPGDITTATYEPADFYASGISSTEGLRMRPNGESLFILSRTPSERIVQIDVTTPQTLKGANKPGIEQNTGVFGTGLDFAPDGKRVFIASPVERIYQFDIF